jgi:hypothetical protein
MGLFAQLDQPLEMMVAPVSMTTADMRFLIFSLSSASSFGSTFSVIFVRLVGQLEYLMRAQQRLAVFRRRHRHRPAEEGVVEEIERQRLLHDDLKPRRRQIVRALEAEHPFGGNLRGAQAPLRCRSPSLLDP